MSEREYQHYLIHKLNEVLPGSFVIKNDSGYVQGIPDLLILFEDKWAMLEVKAHELADNQPNQTYYIDMFNRMSFASFIFPENEEEVLDALQSAFGAPRQTCLFEPQ